jgi:hypothetical protein
MRDSGCSGVTTFSITLRPDGTAAHPLMCILWRIGGVALPPPLDLGCRGDERECPVGFGGNVGGPVRRFEALRMDPRDSQRTLLLFF